MKGFREACRQAQLLPASRCPQSCSCERTQMELGCCVSKSKPDPGLSWGEKIYLAARFGMQTIPWARACAVLQSCWGGHSCAGKKKLPLGGQESEQRFTWLLPVYIH